MGIGMDSASGVSRVVPICEASRGGCLSLEGIYGTEMGSVMAHNITHALRSKSTAH